MILLTEGEKGGSIEVRKAEFEMAMKSWGFNYVRFRFPDLELAYSPLRKMVDKVFRVVDKSNITVLVSFHPNEVTFGFDHPDHNRSGEVTRLVSTAMKGERKLVFWTSNGKSFLTNERYQYAKKFYPSQSIPKKVLKSIGESYLKIR